MATKRLVKSTKYWRLWIFAGIITLGGLLDYMMSQNIGTGHSGNMRCGGDIECQGYFWINVPPSVENYLGEQVNITELCFGNKLQVIFDQPTKVNNFGIYKADKRFRADNPARWNKFNFTGNCLSVGTHEFKINGTKNKEDIVKWGVDNTDIDPIWLETAETEFNGTFNRTKTVGTGAGANLTLNSTIIGTSPQPVYNYTGEYISEVNDTTGTASSFDQIGWTLSNINTSDVMAFSTIAAINHSVAFTRNGTMLVNLTSPQSTLGLVEGINFVQATFTYNISKGFTYDDILGAGIDQDSSLNNTYLFMMNGTTLLDPNSKRYDQNMNFTNYGSWSIPADINKSNIIGMTIEYVGTVAGAFLKNGTVISAASDSPPFTFNSYSTYTLAANFKTNGTDVIGVIVSAADSDMGMIFANGSMLRDSSQSNFVTPSFSSVVDGKVPSYTNATESTNITLYTRASNSTPITADWREYNTSNDGVNNATINQVARYIQYKALLFTPDSYFTPILENVTINYTFGETPAGAGDTTSPISNTSFNISLSTMYTGMVLNFSANMTDEINLTNATFITNLTGIKTFFNYSINGTGNGLGTYIRNITYTLCASPCVANFSVVATDNSSNSRLNDTIVSITTAPAGDTCTYSSGDWNINCADNCVISSAVDVGGNNFIATGSGTVIIKSRINNLGTDNRISGECEVRCEGNCFED